MSILTLNCGSSSVKYALYVPSIKAFACRGLVERVGLPGTVLKHAVGTAELTLARDCPDHTAAVDLVLDILTHDHSPVISDRRQIQAVGHRTVHGGEHFATSALVTSEMISTLEQLSVLAPLHNPPNLAGIRAAKHLLPDIPHVAVFDTAFHQSMPAEAYLYPLPYEWYEKYGIRRYGFHGTSHLYVSRRAAVLLGRPYESLRIVTLHVGNGASAAAVYRGQSLDTSMGFTPLEGLVMGTRCGSIDPAIPLWVMQRESIGPEDMDRILNKHSGLLGLTGRFSDRREIIQAAAAGDQRCQQAIEIEARTLKKAIGSYTAIMGGLDCVVFTAGVGERSALIRERALAGLEFLGIELDPDRNSGATDGLHEEFISTERSQTKVLVIPTNEELVIAEDTLAILEGRFQNDDFSYSFG
jgi:acetate kinase